jgi:hypothetical protein
MAGPHQRIINVLQPIPRHSLAANSRKVRPILPILRIHVSEKTAFRPLTLIAVPSADKRLRLTLAVVTVLAWNAESHTMRTI